MCIGRLEDIVVRPISVGQIIVRGQLADILCNVILIAGTAQNSVSDLYNLRAGDSIARAESTVRVTIDPTLLGSRGNCCICPMIGRNIREGLVTARQFVETSCNGGKLSTSDCCIRTEGTIGVTLKNASVSQSCDFCCCPALICICKAGRGCSILLASVIGKQTVEDCGNFCTG